MVSIFDPWFAHSQISLVELWGVSGDKGLIRPGRCLALGSHIDTHIHTCTLLPHPSTSLDAQCLSGRRDRLKERVQSLTYPPPRASVCTPVEANVSIYQEGRSTGSMTPLGHCERKGRYVWLD